MELVHRFGLTALTAEALRRQSMNGAPMRKCGARRAGHCRRDRLEQALVNASLRLTTSHCTKASNLAAAVRSYLFRSPIRCGLRSAGEWIACLRLRSARLPVDARSALKQRLTTYGARFGRRRLRQPNDRGGIAE